MKKLVFVAALLVLVLSMSCKATLTPQGLYGLAKGIKDARKDLTPENEYFLGRSVSTKVLSNGNYQYRDRDGFESGQLSGMTAYINAVGSVIAYAALDVPRKNDRPAPMTGWHFIVLDDESLNGMSAPGGFVFITAGAVRLCESEDELAALLAHEVAHIVRGHAIGSIKKSRFSSVTKEFLDSSVELSPEAERAMTDVFGGSINDIVDGSLVKGYSKDTEFEADKVGLEILAQAGYDPRALIRLLGNLDQHQDTGSGGFYATHPKASERIAKLEAAVTKLDPRKIPPIRIDRFMSATAELR